MSRRVTPNPDLDTQMTTEDYEAVKPYAVMIEWSGEDGISLATAPDIPRCRTHGATRAEAAANAEEVIASVLAAFADSGVPLPEPRFSALDDAEHARPVAGSA